MDKINTENFYKTKPNYHILNGIADLVRVLNKNNEVVFINKSMEEALEYGKKFCQVDEFIMEPDMTRRTLETGEIVQREEVIGDKSFSVKSSPIIGEHGNLIGAVEVFHETTYEKKLRSEIMSKNRKMTIEMKQASKIQYSLLPAKGFLENIELNYEYRPLNILSGDIFDVFEIDEDNITVYIADAVGHGFASSMITMFIRLMVRNLSEYRLLRPSKAMAEVNRRFRTLNLAIDIYFTFFYGVYNRKTGKFSFSNAGHYPCPIVYDGENIVNLEASGFPISGFFEDVEYKEYYIRLNCSDKILFLTDGVTEAENKQKEFFGIERVYKILENNSVDELKILREELNDFVKSEAGDDITALLLKFW